MFARHLFNSSTSVFSISFVNSCCCWNHSVVRTKCFANVTKGCRHFEAKNCEQTYQFSVMCYLQNRNVVNLPLNSSKFCTPFFFWGTAFSLNWSIADSETSANLAAILKTASFQCFNHRAVIIAGWGGAPSQSCCSTFDNYQCNHTKCD